MSPPPPWPLDERPCAEAPADPGDEHRPPPTREAGEAGLEPLAPRDRRQGRRVRLSLEVAVPVLVRGPDGLQRGLARNISEGGVLVEMREPPAIGAEVEVTITGVYGSTDAPDAVTLRGEVRHHLKWQHAIRGKKSTLRGIGVRFVERQKTSEVLPEWGWSPGDTIH